MVVEPRVKKHPQELDRRLTEIEKVLWKSWKEFGMILNMIKI
jgi:hypothetical protein